MNLASEPTTIDLFGVTVTDPIRLVIAAAVLVAIIAVFVVVGLIEAAEDRAAAAAIDADHAAIAARRRS